MPRDEFNPNDFFDQLAAMSEAALLKKVIDGVEGKKEKLIVQAMFELCKKYGIKGFDAFRFVNELGSVLASIETLENDEWW